MQTDRRVSRRSFLTRVAGGSLIIGAGLIFGAGGHAQQQQKQAATRRMVIDADPSDAARPPGPPAPPPPPPRPADRDSGPNSDPQGMGAVSPPSMPRERFVICPGHSRCPR